MTTPSDAPRGVTFVRPEAPSFVRSEDLPRGPELVVASLRTRAWALVVDARWLGMIAAFSTLGILLLTKAVAGHEAAFGGDRVFETAFPAIALAGLVLYPLMGLRPGGRTVPSLGKVSQRLEIVMTDGRPVARTALVARSVVLALPLWFGVGIGGLIELTTDASPAVPAAINVAGYVLAVLDLGVAPLIGTRRQTLHDRIARTVVVDEPGEDDGAGAPRPIIDRPRSALTPALLGLMLAAMAGSFANHWAALGL